MRSRQFRPSLGLLESRISLSDVSGATGGTGATMYQAGYEYSDNDPDLGSSLMNGPGFTNVCGDPTTSTDGLNGILIDSVIN